MTPQSLLAASCSRKVWRKAETAAPSQEEPDFRKDSVCTSQLRYLTREIARAAVKEENQAEKL